MKFDILIKKLLIQNGNKQKGFTRNELLIVILVLGFIFGIGIKLFSRQPKPEQISELATQNLNAFSESEGIQPIKCNSVDPDKNGYVECIAKGKKGNLLDLQCTYRKKKPKCEFLNKNS